MIERCVQPLSGRRATMMSSVIAASISQRDRWWVWRSWMIGLVGVETSSCALISMESSRTKAAAVTRLASRWESRGTTSPPES